MRGRGGAAGLPVVLAHRAHKNVGGRARSAGGLPCSRSAHTRRRRRCGRVPCRARGARTQDCSWRPWRIECSLDARSLRPPGHSPPENARGGVCRVPIAPLAAMGDDARSLRPACHLPARGSKTQSTGECSTRAIGVSQASPLDAGGGLKLARSSAPVAPLRATGTRHISTASPLCRSSRYPDVPDALRTRLRLLIRPVRIFLDSKH